MTNTKNLEFATSINFHICYYCKFIGFKRVGNNRVELCKQDNRIVYTGCEDFQTSGIPTTQDIKDYIIQRNLLAVSIPTDESAREGSWDFSDKVKKHIGGLI